MNKVWRPNIPRFLDDPTWFDSEEVKAGLIGIGVDSADLEHWSSKIFFESVRLSFALHAEDKPKPLQLSKELSSYRARLEAAIGDYYRLSPAAKESLLEAIVHCPLRDSGADSWPSEPSMYHAQEMVQTLHHWCEQALKSAPPVRAGRARHDALFDFALAIGRIYEEASGRRATRVIRRDNDVSSGGAVETGEYRRFANAVLSSTGRYITDEMAKRVIAALRNGENSSDI